MDATFEERKEDLRRKAIEWSNVRGLVGDWHFAAVIPIELFFEEYGKEYGLTEEFKENYIF